MGSIPFGDFHIFLCPTLVSLLIISSFKCNLPSWKFTITFIYQRIICFGLKNSQIKAPSFVRVHLKMHCSRNGYVYFSISAVAVKVSHITGSYFFLLTSRNACLMMNKKVNFSGLHVCLLSKLHLHFFTSTPHICMLKGYLLHERHPQLFQTTPYHTPWIFHWILSWCLHEQHYLP